MSTRNLKVGYRLTRNATPTADKAPYLGVAVPVGSLAYDNILAKMIDAGTFMTKATAQYFLNAFYEFAAEEIAADVVRLNTGAVSIYPMIGGAFDSEDDTFKEPRNTLYIGATLSQDIRNAVTGIVPDCLGDEAAAGSVKINSVFDLATMTNGVIDGTKDFRICGIDLTVPDGDDESLTFVRKDGITKVADIVVSETADGQRITCHLANNTEAIPKGTYKVRLASHGLDPTAPLSVVTKTVTLVEAIPEPGPETLAFTSATSEGCETGTVKLGKRMTVVGTAMRAPADGEFFQLLCPNGEGSRSTATLESVTVAADGHSLSCTPGEVLGDAPVSGTGEVSLHGKDGELLASCEVNFVAG